MGKQKSKSMGLDGSKSLVQLETPSNAPAGLEKENMYVQHVKHEVLTDVKLSRVGWRNGSTLVKKQRGVAPK